MRVAVNVSEELEQEIKEFAKKENKTLAALFAEAVVYYMTEIQKKNLGKRILQMAGKTKMNPYVFNELDKGRREL
ncbi:MAG: hypothetical protein D6814_00685 [Calditrichaeota bacterium]|nr:MAG: hypothetical protein D6814_00685 [Calditrichota bacterium]